MLGGVPRGPGKRAVPRRGEDRGKWACSGSLAPRPQPCAQAEGLAIQKATGCFLFQPMARPTGKPAAPRSPQYFSSFIAAEPHGHETSRGRPRMLVSGFWGAGGRPQCGWILHSLGKDPLPSPHSPCIVGPRVSVSHARQQSQQWGEGHPAGRLLHCMRCNHTRAWPRLRDFTGTSQSQGARRHGHRGHLPIPAHRTLPAFPHLLLLAPTTLSTRQR